MYGRYPSDPRVRKEARTLVRAGVMIHVVCARAAEERDRDVDDAVIVHRLPLEVQRGGKARYLYQYALFSLLTLVALFFLQLKHRFHIVHIHSLPDFLIFSAIPAKVLGAKLVLDLHESMPELAAARFPAESNLGLLSLAVVAQRLSCMISDRVITVNSQIAEIVSARTGGSQKPVVVENSPDWNYTLRVSADAEPPLLAIACGLNPERDLELVIRTASAVLASRPIEVRIVGSGDKTYVAKLRAMARDLAAENHIRIEDAIPPSEVLEFLSKSTFGVVSYQRNPLTELATPNKAYEYAFLGKPMVVADLPSLRRLLDDSVLYYEPGDSKELMHAILRILDDPPLRKRLGFRASEVAGQHSWAKMGERLLSEYRSVSGLQSATMAGA
ncbi:MAG TPA: glycosyltransferase family 4 protein [Thermoplasmata archaeon]